MGWINRLAFRYETGAGNRTPFFIFECLCHFDGIERLFPLYGTKDYSDRDGLCRMDGNWSHRHIVDRHFLFP